MKDSPLIVVVGAGAVGGIVGGILHEKGFQVTMVTKHQQLAEQIMQTGLKISGPCGSFLAKVPSIASLDELKQKPDYVLIATKTIDFYQVAKQIKPMLKDSTLVVSFQNGIVEEELADLIGSEKTVGCVVGWGATMHEKGVLEMTSIGEFVIGYLDKKTDDRLNELSEILSNIIKTEACDQILNYLYSKLIINSCISSLGAVSGLMLGEMLSKKTYRTIFLQIISEAIEVSEKMEITVPPYAGKLDYYKLLSWGKRRQHLYLRAFGFKFRKLKSSSLQSIERGKKTEINNFNGYIAMKGIQHGVPTPINSKITAIVMEIESGNRKVSVDNLEVM